MRPVAGANVVVRAGVESPGRREEAIHRAHRDAISIPAEDDGQIVRVGQPASTADACRERPMSDLFFATGIVAAAE